MRKIQTHVIISWEAQMNRERKSEIIDTIRNYTSLPIVLVGVGFMMVTEGIMWVAERVRGGPGSIKLWWV